jgi:hypothetical protein
LAGKGSQRLLQLSLLREAFMTTRFNASVLGAALLISVMQITLAAAGETKPVASAPIPTQISSAKKVFIANAGENQPFYNDSIFNGGSERAYDEFYSSMKAWGRYELVGAPADADLVFEIEFTIPRAGPRASSEPNLFGDAPYDPQFRLVIRDPKTNALLWVVTQHVQWAILQGNRDKNFDLAAAMLASKVQGLWTRSGAVASNGRP